MIIAQRKKQALPYAVFMEKMCIAKNLELIIARNVELGSAKTVVMITFCTREEFVSGVMTECSKGRKVSLNGIFSLRIKIKRNLKDGNRQ